MHQIITQFNKAIISLEEVVKMENNPIVHDATIQRFEYVFELAMKVIRIYIKNNYAKISEYDELNFKDNIRIALQLEITKTSLEDWIYVRNSRNKTSHTYNEKISDEVYETAKKFVYSAREVCNLITNKIK